MNVVLHWVRVVVKRPPAPVRVVVLVVALLAYGSTGYLYFELPGKPELSWLDSIWWAFVTMTTIGYGDYFPSSSGGRFLVAVPMGFFGIGLLGYVLSLAASALVQARTKELRGMTEHKLNDHLVIFNFPSLAKVERLLDELAGDPTFQGRVVLLVDEDLDELPPELAHRHVRYVRGNPTRDETLARAAVAQAKYAIVLARQPGDPHSDNLNLAITLAIESLADRAVHTVVECVDFSVEGLLKKAGCDSVVCTSRFDAHFLSHELLNPGVQEVIEDLTSNLGGEQLYLTRWERGEAAFQVVAETCAKHGHLAVGIRSARGPRLNLKAQELVVAGDSIVTIGHERLPAGALG